MAASAGLVLMKRMLRRKAAITNITLPLRLIAGLVGRAGVEVLEISVVGAEPAIARSAVGHRAVLGLRRNLGIWKDFDPQLMGVVEDTAREEISEEAIWRCVTV